MVNKRLLEKDLTFSERRHIIVYMEKPRIGRSTKASPPVQRAAEGGNAAAALWEWTQEGEPNGIKRLVGTTLFPR